MRALAAEMLGSLNRRNISVDAIYRQIIAKTPPGLTPLNRDQQTKLLQDICQLEQRFAGQVKIRSQAHDKTAGRPLSFNDFVATSGNLATRAHIRLVPAKGPKHGSVTARVNINIQPEYSAKLTEALARLCASGNKSIIEAKVIAPEGQGRRIESAAIYLQPGLNNATTIASQLQQLLPAEAFVAHTPVGMHSVADGLSYSENSSKNQLSNGSHSLERAMILKRVLDNPDKIPLDEKLKTAFTKAGYQLDNPALVKKK